VVLAVDIGGTKVAAGLVAADGSLSAHRVVPTSGGTAECAWQPVAQMVREVHACVGERRLVGVGVGSAGPLDLAAGTVSPVNIPAWRGFPLRDRLAALVPGVPVHLAGDGACAAAGEHWHGAGRGADDLLVIVVSTGVGGGLVQRGRLVTGPSGNAGHIGHTVVDVDGDPCPCGGRGCVEAIASGPQMVAWAVRQGWSPGVGGASSDGTPPGGTLWGGASLAVVSAAVLAAAARTGDAVARQAFDRAGRALAAGAVSAAALCDLSRVVVGGGVARAADLLFPPLRTALAGYAHLDFLRGLTVRRAALGTAAGLVGAAALVFAPDRYPVTPATDRR